MSKQQWKIILFCFSNVIFSNIGKYYEFTLEVFWFLNQTCLTNKYEQSETISVCLLYIICSCIASELILLLFYITVGGKIYSVH